MKYLRFEDLPVWQAASDLAVRVFAFGDKAALRRHRSLRDQIERAALSVSNNIAEASEARLQNYSRSCTSREARRVKFVQCYA